MDCTFAGSTTTKIELKTFEFLDSRDSTISSITTKEVLEADYGLYTWPCATVLAQFIIHKKDKLKGKNIVELGAGTALAGLVAASCGAASVLLTDHAEKPKNLDNCRQVAAQSEYNISACGLTWGHFSRLTHELRAGVDVIIAADCFYDSKDFESVLVTVAYLLEANPIAEFWCAYQVRSADWSFDYLFEKWNLKCSWVSLDSFADEVQVVCRGGNSYTASEPTHEILMLIITSNVQL